MTYCRGSKCSISAHIQISSEHKPQKCIAVYWNKPPDNWLNLNTDGAAKGNPGPAGAGGLLRDHFGRIIFAFQEPLGTCSNVQAELKAILRGLQICKDKNLHKIWIEVDALNVIKILENPCQEAWNLQHLLQKTRTLMRSLETKIPHIYREGNQAADFFANQACSTEALTILSPEQIGGKVKGILRLDNLYLPYIRS
ncbi:UNVERIFIED_CONTAM: putative ribonuclease H protein [Sesamum latifolium]|uniref:Ribonuclease H protein n=1 Tax=Sesamum latifolium TaxID=2727402 RepID=A0AAW2XYZ2_9LAMI